MPLTLPDPMNTEDVRKFLRDINVDTFCMCNTNEMLSRYRMVAPLLNKQVGDTIDGVSLIAFRHVFESVVI